MGSPLELGSPGGSHKSVGMLVKNLIIINQYKVWVSLCSKQSCIHQDTMNNANLIQCDTIQYILWIHLHKLSAMEVFTKGDESRPGIDVSKTILWHLKWFTNLVQGEPLKKWFTNLVQGEPLKKFNMHPSLPYFLY